MSGSQRYVPFAVACLLVSTSAAAIAGQQTSQSPLDPLNYTSPAESASKLPAANDAAEPTQTYVTMSAQEGKEGNGKSRLPKVKAPKVPHISLPKLAHKDKDENKPSSPKQPTQKVATAIADKPGMLDKTKQFGSGIANKTKGLGSGIADSTKDLKDGFSNSAKSSADVLKKGAGVIGSGFKGAEDGMKSAGSKVGDGMKSAGSKVKDTSERIVHLGKKPNEAAKDAKIAAKTNNPYPNVHPPKPEKVAHQKQTSGGKVANAGLMDKTFGKLKFWGNKSGGQHIQTASRVTSDAHSLGQ